jgi:hypothetical protein
MIITINLIFYFNTNDSYPYPYTSETNCKVIYEKEFLYKGFTKYLVIIELDNNVSKWTVTKSYYPTDYLNKEIISKCKYIPTNYDKIFIENFDTYEDPYHKFVFYLIFNIFSPIVIYCIIEIIISIISDCYLCFPNSLRLKCSRPKCSRPKCLRPKCLRSKSQLIDGDSFSSNSTSLNKV